MTGPKLGAPLTEGWQDRAACGGHPEPDLWHPNPGNRSRAVAEQIRDAKAICGGCPVIFECLADATASGREGIWGGTTTEEREAQPSARDIAAKYPKRPNMPTPSERCGTYSGAGRHRRLREQFCGPCREARNAYERAYKTRQREDATTPKES